MTGSDICHSVPAEAARCVFELPPESQGCTHWTFHQIGNAHSDVREVRFTLYLEGALEKDWRPGGSQGGRKVNAGELRSEARIQPAESERRKPRGHSWSCFRLWKAQGRVGASPGPSLSYIPAPPVHTCTHTPDPPLPHASGSCSCLSSSPRWGG